MPGALMLLWSRKSRKGPWEPITGRRSFWVGLGRPLAITTWRVRSLTFQERQIPVAAVPLRVQPQSLSLVESGQQPGN